jgi:hypothetical protein
MASTRRRWSWPLRRRWSWPPRAAGLGFRVAPPDLASARRRSCPPRRRWSWHLRRCRSCPLPNSASRAAYRERPSTPPESPIAAALDRPAPPSQMPSAACWDRPIAYAWISRAPCLHVPSASTWSFVLRARARPQYLTGRRSQLQVRLGSACRSPAPRLGPAPCLSMCSSARRDRLVWKAVWHILLRIFSLPDRCSLPASPWPAAAHPHFRSLTCPLAAALSLAATTCRNIKSNLLVTMETSNFQLLYYSRLQDVLP